VSRILGSVASPVVAAITKCDLGPPGPVRKWLSETAPAVRVVETSAKTGQGIEELKALLVEVIEGGGSEGEAVQPIVTTRHKMAISLAAEALARAHGLSESAGGEEFIALELREALDQVGQITGQVSSEDILSDIFSNFCIGK
ncbi:MAG: tRNA uridine-5-carboxymethylaminomethyl(34) synthesis GTPase MnmE, partial [Phycisphaerae bacterium]|jgi:tRNA modification GTPase|nr:tRNA uridine-5-carboxymethylaminomethyl(34) synthesis GTPase MnmE [Phycisphaerae bacterium]